MNSILFRKQAAFEHKTFYVRIHKIKCSPLYAILNLEKTVAESQRYFKDFENEKNEYILQNINL